MILVYYSTKSGNTHRIAQTIGWETTRIEQKADTPVVTHPYVLMFPTYGGGHLEGAIPTRVKDFLNVPENRSLLKAVIGVGNRNFGSAFCLGTRLVAHKCNVPILHEVEVFGTQDDLMIIQEALETLNPQE